jgi:hypothetical protein
MYEVPAVAELIAAGKCLLLAADECLLQCLPRGAWIGGTIPYFMTERGGAKTHEQIHVTQLPSCASVAAIKYYDERTIPNVYVDGHVDGFSFIMIPAMSRTHMAFALKAPTYRGFATLPLIGWVTGVDLADFGKLPPKIFHGEASRSYDEGAIVMHVRLPADKVAELDILNMFRQGEGESIEFLEDSFTAREALIDNRREPLVEYLRRRQIDTRLPLVADYAGAMINTCFQNVDASTGIVSFYAPVFRGVQYKVAAAEGDYVESFAHRMPDTEGQSILFSCNCILNYLYAGLEGRRTGGITGPVTFGEIAYQLLNQTLVYLRITDR